MTSPWSWEPSPARGWNNITAIIARSSSDEIFFFHGSPLTNSRSICWRHPYTPVLQNFSVPRTPRHPSSKSDIAPLSFPPSLPWLERQHGRRLTSLLQPPARNRRPCLQPALDPHHRCFHQSDSLRPLGRLAASVPNGAKKDPSHTRTPNANCSLPIACVSYPTLTIPRSRTRCSCPHVQHALFAESPKLQSFRFTCNPNQPTLQPASTFPRSRDTKNSKQKQERTSLFSLLPSLPTTPSRMHQPVVRGEANP